MNDISSSHVILVTHFQRIPSILALDGGAQILAGFRALRTNVGVHFMDMGIQLEDIGMQLEDTRLEI